MQRKQIQSKSVRKKKPVQQVQNHGRKIHTEDKLRKYTPFSLSSPFSLPAFLNPNTTSQIKYFGLSICAVVQPTYQSTKSTKRQHNDQHFDNF